MSLAPQSGTHGISVHDLSDEEVAFLTHEYVFY